MSQPHTSTHPQLQIEKKQNKQGRVNEAGDKDGGEKKLKINLCDSTLRASEIHYYIIDVCSLRCLRIIFVILSTSDY